MNREIPLVHSEEPMMILSLSVFEFAFVEIVHVELNGSGITCL